MVKFSLRCVSRFLDAGFFDPRYMPSFSHTTQSLASQSVAPIKTSTYIHGLPSAADLKRAPAMNIQCTWFTGNNTECNVPAPNTADIGLGQFYFTDHTNLTNKPMYAFSRFLRLLHFFPLTVPFSFYSLSAPFIRFFPHFPFHF